MRRTQYAFRPLLISSRNRSWCRRHEHRHDKPAVLHQRSRRLHPDARVQRAVGSEIDARPRGRRTACPCNQRTPRRRGIRTRALDGGHVSSAQHHDPRRDQDEADPRRPAHPRDRSRLHFRRHRDGARIVPAAAADGESRWRCLVNAELGRAEARGYPGADRSQARHERQMDHAPDRGPHGLARSAAALDERGPRTGRRHGPSRRSTASRWRRILRAPLPTPARRDSVSSTAT